MTIPNFETIAVNTAIEFFRTTRRIVSVKYYVSPATFADGVLKVQHAFKEVSNPITDFGNFQNWDIFRVYQNMPPEWNGMPPWWQRIIFYPDGKPR